MKKIVMSSEELLRQNVSFTNGNTLTVEIKGKLYIALYSQVGEYKYDFGWVLTPMEEDNNVMYMVKDTETQGNKYLDYITGTYWRCFETKAEASEYVRKYQDELLFIVSFTQEDMEILKRMQGELVEEDNEDIDLSDEELELLDDEDDDLEHFITEEEWLDEEEEEE